jgi:hypothetical protein
MSGGRIYAESAKTPASDSVSFMRPRPSAAPAPRLDASRGQAAPLSREENLAALRAWAKRDRVVFDYMVGGRMARPAASLAPALPLQEAPPTPLQAKLEVGAIDTPEEREADAVAARVMGSAAPPPADVSPSPAPIQAQRLAAPSAGPPSRLRARYVRVG